MTDDTWEARQRARGRRAAFFGRITGYVLVVLFAFAGWKLAGVLWRHLR
jgi:hypothetical protein